MINYIMKKYALSRQGAKDLIIATISCVVHNLMLMLPVSLLYFLVSDLYEGGVPQSHLWIYIVGMIAGVLLILFSYRWVYGATYYATYKKVRCGVFLWRRNFANFRCRSSVKKIFPILLRRLWLIVQRWNSLFRIGCLSFSVL